MTARKAARATAAFGGARGAVPQQTWSPPPPPPLPQHRQRQNTHLYHRVPQPARVTPTPLAFQLHPSVRARPSVPREVTPTRAAEPAARASLGLPTGRLPRATRGPFMPPVEVLEMTGFAAGAARSPPARSSPSQSLFVSQSERTATQESSDRHSSDGNASDGQRSSDAVLESIDVESIPETPPASYSDSDSDHIELYSEPKSDSESDSDSDYRPVCNIRARVSRTPPPQIFPPFLRASICISFLLDCA